MSRRGGRLGAHGEGTVRLAEIGGQAADAPGAGAEGPGPGEIPGIEVARPAEPVVTQEPAELVIVFLGAVDQGALLVMFDDQPPGGIAGGGLVLVSRVTGIVC